MVSDYPERLERTACSSRADLHAEHAIAFSVLPLQSARAARSAHRAARRESVVRAAIVQFISGRGGPRANEMEVGHLDHEALSRQRVQNQGASVTIPANTSINLVKQDLPAGNIVCNLLQLRVLSGSDVHLTLFAQNATDDPDVALATLDLLARRRTSTRAASIRSRSSTSPRSGTSTATTWSCRSASSRCRTCCKGEALAGDYGVLQSFIVNVQTRLSTPQSIAIYENPRGGRATGTYLIDGVLVQSHQVPPFSRYKVRQYVVPARGFVRVTIVTMPEGGSSYPLRLIFAPDDGSVAPGAPGSPIY